MRYWAYVNGEVPGSFAPEELAALPGFGAATLVCPAEGRIEEKNWRRAGEFDELARAIADRAEKAPPPPPAATVADAASAAAAASIDVDAMIDGASVRLFGHVASLMKELEGRREEKAVVASFQRQLLALKEELLLARERAATAESRLPRIDELEASQRKDREAIQTLQETLRGREEAWQQSRALAERLRLDLETSERRLQESKAELAARSRLAETLSKDLSEKEVSLAKALSVIRRLEEEMGRLGDKAAVPPPAPAPRAAAASAPLPPPPAPVEPPPLPSTAFAVPVVPLVEDAVPKPAPEPVRSFEPAQFTTDEPPPSQPYLENPPEAPKAHEALLGFIRKFFPGQTH